MKWISVKEQKPPVNVWIMIFTYGTLDKAGNKDPYPPYVVNFTEYESEEEFSGDANGGCCRLHDVDGKITHWMPLPEEPKD